MREDLLRRRVAVNLEKSRRAIRHGERATVQRRRWSKEIQTRKLIDPRMRSVLVLVSPGDDSLRRRDAIEFVPGIARLDPVDTPSPRVVGDMSRRGCFRCFTQRQNIGGRAMAETAKVRLDLGEHLRGQSPAKVRAEKRVVVVLIAEPWRILEELGHKAFGSSLAGEAHHVPKLTHWPSHAIKPSYNGEPRCCLAAKSSPATRCLRRDSLSRRQRKRRCCPNRNSAKPVPM